MEHFSLNHFSVDKIERADNCVHCHSVEADWSDVSTLFNFGIINLTFLVQTTIFPSYKKERN